MKLSFHTCGLEWWSLEDAINELADIGYDACGPILAPGGHVDPDKITSSEIERYKQLAADRNLAISTLNPWKIGGFATKVESGETERFFRRALDLAAEFGAGSVKFLAGSHPDGEMDGWKAMVKVCKRLCHHAEQVGVDLLMQNHENQLIDTSNCFALLRHHVGSERLQATLDVSNMAILMEDPCRAIHDHADSIRYVRIKGMLLHYPYATQCAPGAPGDIVDWKAVFTALKEVGYTGYIEPVTYPWFPPDFHRTNYEWCREMAAEVGL